MVNITYVDVLRLASSIPYANLIQNIPLAPVNDNEISFLSYDDSFVNDILGPDVSQEFVAERDWTAFHEAGVYNIETGLLYV